MIDLIQQKIMGLTAKREDLRSKRDGFLKAQGFEEQRALAQVKVQELSAKVLEDSKILGAINQQKAAVVGGVRAKIEERISAILPYGKAVFQINDDSIFVGWDIEGRGVVPYEGLSGGQEVAYRPALGCALGGNGEKLIIIEGGEMDQETMSKMLQHLAASPPEKTQVIVNTWSAPCSENIPAEWEVTKLK